MARPRSGAQRGDPSWHARVAAGGRLSGFVHGSRCRTCPVSKPTLTCASRPRERSSSKRSWVRRRRWRARYRRSCCRPGRLLRRGRRRSRGPRGACRAADLARRVVSEPSARAPRSVGSSARNTSECAILLEQAKHRGEIRSAVDLRLVIDAVFGTALARAIMLGGDHDRKRCQFPCAGLNGTAAKETTTGVMSLQPQGHSSLRGRCVLVTVSVRNGIADSRIHRRASSAHRTCATVAARRDRGGHSRSAGASGQTLRQPRMDAAHRHCRTRREPADCAVREVLEETGIHVVARRLAWVHVTRPMVHANGDHAQYLDHVFRMDWVDGEPFPADDESLDARWFDLAMMPHMSGDMRRRIELASDDSLECSHDFRHPA